MKYCAETILVGLDHELPEDPAVAYSGNPPFVGCNHLVCENCGAVVRQADSRATSSNYSPPRDELQRLYESSDPASSPLLVNGPLHRESRAYFCRCDWRSVDVGGALFCDLIDQPWKCGGHQPGMTLAHDVRAAAARQAVDAVVAATVPIVILETASLKKCAKVLLVGLDDELPSDPSVAYDGTPPPFIGCNHLVCSRCGAVVRHVDSRSTTSNYTPPGAELEKLYESSDPASSPLLDSAPIYKNSRAYFCRCEWAAAEIVRFVASLDAPWKCGGHGPPVVLEAPNVGAQVVEARDIRHAEARKATDALIAATVPIFIPETGAKIRLHHALNVDPEFATASELRDSLLASYPEAAQTGVPLVRRHRGEDSAPAWGWVNDFLLMRSDWWPAIGIALQHAATDGGELAQTALVELLAHFNASIALLPWTAPIAELWPDRRTVMVPATGWGGHEGRLDAVIRDQKKYLIDVAPAKARAFLDGYGVGGKPTIGPLTNEVELRALLVETAHAGQFPDGNKGPWSWLAFEFLIGDEWLRPAFVNIVNALDHTDEAMIFALLDWCSEEQDLWKFAQLLNGWHAHPPSWWTTFADTRPHGWKWTMRSAHWPEVKTLGDVATEALRRAKWQVVTPPVIDLPQLYGLSIS